MSASPHDAVFKAVLGEPEHAASALRAVLPAPVAAALDWSSIARAPGSFIDDELREQHTDLLFEVRWARGGDAGVYLLFEHQSTPDPRMALRLVRYTLRIWERGSAETTGALELPVVLPVVLYHGAPPWSAARALEALYACPDDLRAAVADASTRSTYLVDDLSRVSDRELRDRRMTGLATLAVLCLKHARTAVDLVALLHDWLDVVRACLLAPRGPGALEPVLRCILEVNERAQPEAVRALIERAGGGHIHIEDTVMTWGQQMIQQGFDKGIQQGREEGQLQGKRALLLLILRQRYGELDAAVEQRVSTAAADQIDRWSVRVLTAPTLAAVLAD